jgi:hypothetical protein
MAGEQHGASAELLAAPLLVPGFATVGAIVVARHRGHIVGWLFLGLAAVTALGGFCEAYAIRAYLTGTLPAGAYLVWATNWLAGLFLLPLRLLLLVFPTGRLPSGRWRLVAWVLVVSTTYLVVKFMLSPVLGLQIGRTESIEIANPVLSVAVVSTVILPYSVAVFSAWAALAMAALAPLVRFRQAGQVERQQLKWLAFVLAVGVVGGLVAAALTYVLPGVANGLAVLVGIELALGIPFAVGAAILRYRLYDIDRLINRTLVYGLLTILLGGVYAGLVLTLGQLAGGSAPTRRAGRWPAPPWRWRRCSNRFGAVSSRRWTGASTGAATTPPRPLRRSALACGMRSTWTPSPPSSWPWSTRRCSRHRRHCGSGLTRHPPNRARSDQIDAEHQATDLAGSGSSAGRQRVAGSSMGGAYRCWIGPIRLPSGR